MIFRLPICTSCIGQFVHPVRVGWKGDIVINQSIRVHENLVQHPSKYVSISNTCRCEASLYTICSNSFIFVNNQYGDGGW